MKSTLLNLLESTLNFLLGKGFFPRWHAWDLKNAIYSFALPRLKAYRRLLEENKAMSVPDWIEEEDMRPGVSREERWLQLVTMMIAAMEMQVHGKRGDSHECNDAEREAGLLLFQKYLNHLWD